MQVERIDDMKVGDFIQLPTGGWDTNQEAQAMYAKAQAVTASHQGNDPAPQYQVQNEPDEKARLERIR